MRFRDCGRALWRLPASRDLSRTRRERLLAGGFLKKVIKGWYISSRPDDAPGDSTAWYVSFWDWAGGHSTIAGRLAGAFRNAGNTRIADEIVRTMETAGYDVRETDPFEDRPAVAFAGREVSPYVNRMRLMWEAMRRPVLDVFPDAPGIPADQAAYLRAVDGQDIRPFAQFVGGLVASGLRGAPRRPCPARAGRAWSKAMASSTVSFRWFTRTKPSSSSRQAAAYAAHLRGR